jgi:chromosome segregation ATPase
MDGSEQESGEGLILSAETLRSSSSRGAKDEPPGKSGDEKISIFWRVFGGTILSICALVGITVYQSIAGNIHDLRNDLSQVKESRGDFTKKDEFATLRAEVGSIREAKGDLVRKEDFSSSKTQIWNRFTDVEKNVGSITSSLADLKANLNHYDNELKGFKTEKDSILTACKAEMGALKDKLTVVEQQIKSVEQAQHTVEADRKAQEGLVGSVAALQAKSASRDFQLRGADDERKDLARQISELRERLAKMEAHHEYRPPAPTQPPASPAPQTPPEKPAGGD